MSTPAYDGLGGTHDPEIEAARSAPELRLQGVVMAVRGVSAEMASTSVRWHSVSLGVTARELAESVMAFLDRQQSVITAPALDELLQGHALTRPAATNPAHRPSPDRTQAPGSLLYLVPTSRGVPVEETNLRWAWQSQGLTRRESDVLSLIGQAWSNHEIAETLFLTENTVKSYIRTAYRKIGAQRRVQAVRWVIEHE